MQKCSAWQKYYWSKRNEIIKNFGVHCQACGKKLDRRSAQFAHVKPTGLMGASRGSFQRLKDVITNRFSYRLLCKACHLDYDGKDNNRRQPQ